MNKCSFQHMINRLIMLQVLLAQNVAVLEL